MAKVKNIPEFIKLFTEGKVKNLEEFRTYLVYEYGDLSVLQYKRAYTEQVWLGNGYGTVEKKNEEILAYRFPDGSCICNANEIRSVGEGTIYGKRDREGENEIQRILQMYGAVPIPFTLFKESRLDVREFSWILKPVAENVTVKRKKEVYNHNTLRWDSVIEDVDRHFVGASIFKIEDEIFFFDIDRQEIDHGIFNAFITKLPRIAYSVKEAYDLLMPDEVKEAIYNGIEVKRQGEFFFIKVSEESPNISPLSKEEIKILKCRPSRLGYIEINEITDYDIGHLHQRYDADELTSPGRIAFNDAANKYYAVFDKITATRGNSGGTLGKSSSASHTVGKYLKIDDVVYVSERVSQSRRQHADLSLPGWYKVVPNTGVFSWTITGKVD
jgi:hypothetical protein